MPQSTILITERRDHTTRICTQCSLFVDEFEQPDPYYYSVWEVEYINNILVDKKCKHQKPEVKNDNV